MLHHPHIIFSHKLLRTFSMQCPRLRQRLFHSTFSKTQASKSFFSSRISSGVKQWLCCNQWHSWWSFCLCVVSCHTYRFACIHLLSCLLPGLSDPWGRAHCSIVCLHGMLFHGVFYEAPRSDFITLTTQSTTAHEVAVPSLRAEPSSSAAIQETNSSFTASKMVQDSLFYPGLFHLA